jgi:hypothetical protein
LFIFEPFCPEVKLYAEEELAHLAAGAVEENAVLLADEFLLDSLKFGDVVYSVILRALCGDDNDLPGIAAFKEVNGVGDAFG